MPKPLPLRSGRIVARVFERAGWEWDRLHRGHLLYLRRGEPAVLSIPDHSVIYPDTLRQLLRIASMTNEEYLRHLDAIEDLDRRERS